VVIIFLQHKVRRHLTIEHYEQLMKYFSKHSIKLALTLLKFLEANFRQTNEIYNLILLSHLKYAKENYEDNLIKNKKNSTSNVKNL